MAVLRKIFAFALICFLLALPPVWGQDGNLASKVKGAFLYNFAAFVEWPSRPDNDFVVGLLGHDAITESVAGLQGKRVSGRTLVVRNISASDDFATCNILYVATSEKPRMSQILQKAEGKSVLTVSDIPRFAETGGMVGFFIQNSRVKFEICLQCANRNGLKLSAKLLQVARLANCDN